MLSATPEQPVNPPTVRTAWHALRRNPVVRATVPIEARFTPPIPVVDGKQVALEALAYGATKVPGEHAKLFRPRVRVAIGYPDGRCLRYEDFAYEDRYPGVPFDEPLGVFPHSAVAKWAVSEFRRAEERLLELTERLIVSMRDGHADESAWAEAAVLWAAILPPFLRGYVTPLNSEFFGRLRAFPAS